VGIQLAWNLRPFISDKNEDFKLFRKYEGNFYTAVIYSVNQLLSGNDSSKNFEMKPLSNTDNSTTSEQNDTTDVLNIFK
jgi:hypothetical protein